MLLHSFPGHTKRLGDLFEIPEYVVSYDEFPESMDTQVVQCFVAGREAAGHMDDLCCGLLLHYMSQDQQLVTVSIDSPRDITTINNFSSGQSSTSTIEPSPPTLQ
jgi:hypothetical protein